MSANSAEPFIFVMEFWVGSIYNFLLQYAFGEEAEQEQLLNALTALYNGKIASHAIEMQGFHEQIKGLTLSHRNELMVQKMESIHQHITEEFWKQKPQLVKMWMAQVEQAKSVRWLYGVYTQSADRSTQR